MSEELKTTLFSRRQVNRRVDFERGKGKRNLKKSADNAFFSYGAAKCGETLLPNMALAGG